MALSPNELEALITTIKVHCSQIEGALLPTGVVAIQNEHLIKASLAVQRECLDKIDSDLQAWRRQHRQTTP